MAWLPANQRNHRCTPRRLRCSMRARQTQPSLRRRLAASWSLHPGGRGSHCRSDPKYRLFCCSQRRCSMFWALSWRIWGLFWPDCRQVSRLCLSQWWLLSSVPWRMPQCTWGLQRIVARIFPSASICSTSFRYAPWWRCLISLFVIIALFWLYFNKEK